MTPNTLLDKLDNDLKAKHAKGLSFRLTDFLWDIVDIQQMIIDTPEERAAVSARLMGFYDAKISLHVPEVMRASTRAYVKDWIDKSLIVAATFDDKPAPVPTPTPAPITP